MKDPTTGKWSILPEYEEKFGALMKKSKPRRNSGNTKKIPSSVAVATSLRKLLYKK
ncbi:hypothetical protein D3C71_1944420 [compost metagenome]